MINESYRYIDGQYIYTCLVTSSCGHIREVERKSNKRPLSYSYYYKSRFECNECLKAKKII